MNLRHRLHILLQMVTLLAVCSACYAGTIGEAKRDLPDGSPVSFSGVSVTAIFPGSIYVEQSNRSGGIRVDTTRTFAEGDIVGVSGVIRTDLVTDERYIAASTGYPQAAGGRFDIRPLGLVSRSFVGGNFGLQQGIAGSHGLNTIGQLVTICGPVAEFDDPVNPNWFKVGKSNDTQIKVVMPAGVKIDTDWAYVSVTGICSVEKTNGSMVRVLKVRKTSDVVSRQSWAENILKTMTVDDKVGQLFQIRFDGDVLTDTVRQTIIDKHIGGIIYFQYNGNLDDPVRTAQLSNDLQDCVLGPGGSAIPLLLSMDQEGGRVTRITGGTDFPGNMGLGATRSTSMAYTVGSVIGSEIKAVGANMDLAPVLDVNNNPGNPVIGVRSFGERPELASSMGQGYMNGLHSTGIIATGKHFPGHGDTNVDSHSGLPVVSYDFNTLDTIHGRPFREAIANGLDAIMTAHIVVTCLDPNRPATLSPLVIDNYLRSNLGFDGVVMTDSMGMAGVTKGYGNDVAAVMAIQAGVDLLSLPPDLDVAWNAVKTAVLNGQITQARLDQAVTRILRLKHKYGLFNNPYVVPENASGIIGNADHKAAELSVARAAITLVQNKNGLLPLYLTPNQKVLLVTVQSSTETTSNAASQFNSYITMKHPNVQSMAISANPNSTARTNVKTAAGSAAVVIIGTSRANSIVPDNSGQLTLVQELCAMGKPVVAVGLREPYELAGFPQVNAYLAAYNYRDCGFQAVADVIFGDINPSGLLPVSIPGSYSYGYGLSY